MFLDVPYYFCDIYKGDYREIAMFINQNALMYKIAPKLSYD